MNIDSVLKNHGIGGSGNLIKENSTIDYYMLNEYKVEELQKKMITNFKINNMVSHNGNLIGYNGTTIYKLDLDGNLVWSKTVEQTSLQHLDVDNNGDVWAVYYNTEGVNSKYGLYKIGSSAGEILINIPELRSSTVPRCIDCGDYIYIGYSNGYIDKYDLDGSIVLSSQASSVYDYRGLSGAKTNSNFICASFNSHSGRIQVIKKSDLSFYTTRVFDSTNLNYVGAIIYDGVSSVYIRWSNTIVYKINILNTGDVIVWTVNIPFSNGTLSNTLFLNQNTNEVCVSRTTAGYDYQSPGVVFIKTLDAEIKSYTLPINYKGTSSICSDQLNNVYINYFGSNENDVIGISKFTRVYRITNSLKVLGRS